MADNSNEFRFRSSTRNALTAVITQIVMGVASLLKRPIMGNFNKSNLINTWANSDAIDKVHKFYGEAKGATQRERVFNTFRDQLSSLSGVDGYDKKEFADIFKISKDRNGRTVVGNGKIKDALNSLTDAVMAEKLDKKAVKKAYNAIIEETHIAENIKFESYETSNYYYPFAKVCDSRTITISPNTPYNESLWIDIFPLDNVSENSKINFLKILNTYQHSILEKKVKDCIKLIMLILVKIKLKDF